MAFESMKFNCISLNVRGLNKSDKRRKVFRWIHQQKAQIVFLQETFSTKDVQTKWRSEWGGQVFYSHGSNHSKGVMILINPNFNIQIQRTIHDKSGRFLILKASIEESDVVFVNVYAPNDNASQITFYKILQDRLKEFSDDNLIIAGDFNCPLSPLDKRGGKTVFKKKQCTKRNPKTNFVIRLDRRMERLLSTTIRIHLERQSVESSDSLRLFSRI